MAGPIGFGITPAAAEQSRTLRSPGLLVSHYAPALPVRLRAETVASDEALLAFGPPLPGAAVTFQLSPDGDTIAGRVYDCSPGCAGWMRRARDWACAASRRWPSRTADWVRQSTTGCNARRRRDDRVTTSW